MIVDTVRQCTSAKNTKMIVALLSLPSEFQNLFVEDRCVNNYEVLQIITVYRDDGFHTMLRVQIRASNSFWKEIKKGIQRETTADLRLDK